MATRFEGFVVCIENEGYGASLEVRKLYPLIRDAAAESNQLARVIDESGEDYLYPARLFRKLAIPADVQRVLRKASLKASGAGCARLFSGTRPHRHDWPPREISQTEIARNYPR